MNKHGMTQEHAIRESYDADNKALRTTLISAEIQLSLDAQHDSITSHFSSATLTDGTHDCKGMHWVCIFDSSSTAQLSPDDSGETWVSLALIPLTPAAICARRIKVSGKVVVQA